jgi:DICT domain-containing protein
MFTGNKAAKNGWQSRNELRSRFRRTCDEQPSEAVASVHCDKFFDGLIEVAIDLLQRMPCAKVAGAAAGDPGR